MAEASLFSSSSPPPFHNTAALVDFLRREADEAEKRAKRLRRQANALITQYGITAEQQKQYELNPSDLPPLDEHGNPKYAGKKRGRKAKPRKRKMNPLRPKRQHTAYTLFVHETYPDIKTSQPDLKGQQIMPMVAKLWREKTAAEKQEWKVRAQATHSNNVDEDGVDEDPSSNNTATSRKIDEDDAAAAAAAAAEDEDMEEEEDVAVGDADEEQEVLDEQEEEEEEIPAPARRRTTSKRSRGI